MWNNRKMHTQNTCMSSFCITLQCVVEICSSIDFGCSIGFGIADQLVDVLISSSSKFFAWVLSLWGGSSWSSMMWADLLWRWCVCSKRMVNEFWKLKYFKSQSIAIKLLIYDRKQLACDGFYRKGWNLILRIWKDEFLPMVW